MQGECSIQLWHAPEEYTYRFPGLPNSFATIWPSTQSFQEDRRIVHPQSFSCHNRDIASDAIRRVALEYSLYFQDTPDSFAFGAFEKQIEGHGHLIGSRKIVSHVPTRKRARLALMFSELSCSPRFDSTGATLRHNCTLKNSRRTNSEFPLFVCFAGLTCLSNWA